MEYVKPNVELWNYTIELEPDTIVALAVDEHIEDGWRFAVVDYPISSDLHHNYKQVTVSSILDGYRLVKYNGRNVQVTGCKNRMTRSATDAPDGRLCPDGMQWVYRLVEVSEEGLSFINSKTPNGVGECIAESIEELMALVTIIGRNLPESEGFHMKDVFANPRFIIEQMPLAKLAQQQVDIVFRGQHIDLTKLFELNDAFNADINDPEEKLIRGLQNGGSNVSE